MAADGGGARASASTLPAPVTLDRSLFDQSLPVLALVVPTARCQGYAKSLGEHLLCRPGVRRVVEADGDRGHKLLLLREEYHRDAPASARTGSDGADEEASGPGSADGAGGVDGAAGGAEATAEVVVGGRAHRVPASLASVAEADGLEFSEKTVGLSYENVSSAEALRRLLPSTVVVPTAFESVGHVAHVNLRDDALPYKDVIGQVFLDKNPKIRTVVNKTGSIHAEFRTFDMEVLAGDPSTVTEVSEHGARFRLDFRSVYWNSRLEREHGRLVDLHVRPGQIVLDACAGVGPFAIPAGRRGATVFASDLNPASHRWLRVNVALNRLSGRVFTNCLDAREAIRIAASGSLAGESVPEDEARRQARARRESEAGGDAAVARRETEDGGAPAGAAPSSTHASPPPAPPTCPAPFHHVILNLPASAVELLDCLKGSFPRALWPSPDDLPLMHVYTFAPDATPTAVLRGTIEKHLGGELDSDPIVHPVRDVSPKKTMFCVSFRVPASLAYPGAEETGSTEEAPGASRSSAALPAGKKARLDGAA